MDKEELWVLGRSLGLRIPGLEWGVRGTQVGCNRFFS